MHGISPEFRFPNSKVFGRKIAKPNQLNCPHFGKVAVVEAELDGLTESE